MGHYNYFVMPEELYEKVKDDIAPEIGVYICFYDEHLKRYNCKSVKKAKEQPVTVNTELLKHNFMQALIREHDKYRRGLIYCEKEKREKQ